MTSVRAAVIEDIALIRELCFSVWPQTFAGIISQEQINYMLEMMYSTQALTKQMEDEGACFIIVYADDIPQGFASYGQESNNNWKLHKLYVLPQAQGKGLGKVMIDYIIRAIQPLGAKTLLLQVNRHNKAKQFYDKLGFKVLKMADFDIGRGYFMNDYVMALSI